MGFLLAGIICVGCSEEDDDNKDPDPEVISFYRTFGGDNEDRGQSVRELAGGGYILCGYTQSFGEGLRDVYLIKTDERGTVLWSKTFGGNDHDPGSLAEQTADGGFIVSGGTKSFGAGASDFYIIKLNANGDQQWYKTYGDASWESGITRQTTDGGYIVCGSARASTTSDYAINVIRLDAQGDKQWTSVWNGNGDDYAHWIQELSDGTFLICGATSSIGAGNKDVLLLKIDANGDELWYRTYGGENEDVSRSFRVLTDGSIILVGGTRSTANGDRDIWLLKLDGLGNVMWDKKYGGADDEAGRAVVLVNDGGFALCGATESEDTDAINDDVASAMARSLEERKLYLIRTDNTGTVLWSRSFDGFDKGYSMVDTKDNGFAICGATHEAENPLSKVFLIKTTSTGYVEGLP